MKMMLQQYHYKHLSVFFKKINLYKSGGKKVFSITLKMVKIWFRLFSNVIKEYFCINTVNMKNHISEEGIDPVFARRKYHTNTLTYPWKLDRIDSSHDKNNCKIFTLPIH